MEGTGQVLDVHSWDDIVPCCPLSVHLCVFMNLYLFSTAMADLEVG